MWFKPHTYISTIHVDRRLHDILQHCSTKFDINLDLIKPYTVPKYLYNITNYTYFHARLLADQLRVGDNVNGRRLLKTDFNAS